MVYGFLWDMSTMEHLSMDFFGIPTTFLTRLHNILIQFSSLILIVVLIMITTGVLVDFAAGTRPYPSCRYILCILLPPWVEEDNKWWYCNN